MRIDFSKKFYSAKALKFSFGAFKELASFKLKQEKGFFKVFLRPVLKEDSLLLKDEFSNFVLFESLKDHL